MKVAGGSKKSLDGRTIVVTRRKEQAEEVVTKLEELGAAVIVFPTIEIHEPASWTDCDSALQRIADYNGIIFTSANAVEYFFHRAKHLGLFQLIASREIYTIGEKTKHAVHRYGFKPEELPENSSSEQLGNAIVRRAVTGKKFLFPKGNLARGEVVIVLSAHGAVVDEVIVYETKKPLLDDTAAAMAETIKRSGELIVFFSPSSIVNFLHDIPLGQLKTRNCAVIGETTADAARKNGLTVVVTAPRSTTESLVHGIHQYFGSHS